MAIRDIQINTLIGKGCELFGDFSCEGSARIDGRINGNVNVKGGVIVGSSGVIMGDVKAESLVLGGVIEGDIDAPKKVELTETAKLVGDIVTGVIVIDEHAIFQGKIDMNQPVSDKKSKLKTLKAFSKSKKSAKAALTEVLKEVAEAQQEADEETADEA